MFSGLVQTQGTITAINELDGGLEYQVKADFSATSTDPLQIGESICTQGVCLTVTEIHPDGYSVQIMPETLRVTSLGQRKVGDRVNLERALQVSDRIGGHLVAGHVDCLAVVSALEKGEKWATMRVDFPASLIGEVARKGSICLDGVSLTVTQVGSYPPGETGKVAAPSGEKKLGAWLEVALIPLSQQETTLGTIKVGDGINLETDLVAKYVAQATRIQLAGE